MRRWKTGSVGILLSVVMVAGLIGARPYTIGDTTFSQSTTVLKTFTISDEELENIAETAETDGSKAATLVNGLEGNDFEAAVNKVLTTYYESSDKEELKNFENDVDKKADGIIENYAEAAEERANAEELSYEAGVSLLSFGTDVSEEQIKAVVKDQYGECEYIHKSPDGTYMAKVKNSLGLTVEKAVDAYENYVETTSVDVNNKVQQTAEWYNSTNDPYLSSQYSIRTMNVYNAWNYISARQHSKIKVAVIDGGISKDCLDLKNILSGQSVEVQEDGSYIPLSQTTTTYSTSNMHGTNVCGILAAQANNGVQVAGIASCYDNSCADLIGINIPMYVDKIVVGIDYALSCGAKVINMSLFHEGSNDAEYAACARFKNAGGTIVAGAGNNGGDVKGYPSDYDNTISIISVDESNNRAGTSNYGWEKDLCAPGASIYVAGPTDDVWIVGGTSMASPNAAGVVTLMYSINPSLNFDEVKNILTGTATDLGDAGRDYYFGYGLINAYEAVVQADSGSQTITTTAATTTAAASGGPQEVFGEIISSPSNNCISVVWGSNSEMEAAGQTYNVYIDNNRVSSNVGCAQQNYYDITVGTHTVKITSVYNGQESTGVTAQVNVEGEVATTEPPTTETSTTAVSLLPEYVTAGENWTDLDYWSVYFASGWGNNPTGSYKAGNSYNDFGVYVNTYSGAAWGIQIKTKVLNTTVGNTYVCRVSADFNMDMTDTILFKEEGTQTEKTYTLSNGTNNFEIEFTPTADNSQIFFDLGKLPEGSNFVITGFSLEEKQQETTTEEITTVPETTTEKITTAPETKTEETTTVPETTTEAITTVPETTTEEITTEPENTNKDTITISDAIQVNGYQISTTLGGSRVVGSVEPVINNKNVVSWGFIYAITKAGEDTFDVSESDMIVGAESRYVAAFESTSAGTVENVKFGTSDTATYFVRTMLFGANTAKEYQAQYKVRAYAQLSDGSYVYSEVSSYSIYNIANTLYTNRMMNTITAHNYLYDNILKVVNPDYQEVDYSWNNIIVNPSNIK